MNKARGNPEAEEKTNRKTFIPAPPPESNAWTKPSTSTGSDNSLTDKITQIVMRMIPMIIEQVNSTNDG